MKHTRFVSFFLILCFLGAPLRSLDAQKSSISVLGNEDFLTIPFIYSQGFIIVEVVFSYLFPMKFIVDTGAEHTILLDREYVDILQLRYEKEIKIVGADITSDMKAWVVRNVSLQLYEGQNTIQDIIVLNEDIMNLGALTGMKIDGILGVEFLKNFIVDINYKESVIRLYKGSHSRDKWNKFENLPIELNNNKPYLKAEINLSGQAAETNLLLLDTGAAISLMLHNDLDSLKNLPSNIIVGVIGKGIGGDVIGYSGKIHSLTFGSNSYENLVTSFQSIDTLILNEDKLFRDGIIGNYILENYHVVFDFPRSLLLIKKRKIKKSSLLIDKSGLVVYAFGPNFKQYYIHHVVQNSPGNEAGFRRGDILNKIGIWPAGLYSLNSINRKLSKENKEVNLTVKRDDEVYREKIILRDLYDLKK
ncbi:MAG: aspartyl protease family protein [Saprospiraceae bacterium]